MSDSTFLPTRWSAILDASDSASPTQGTSLNYLAQAYWYPLYAHARRVLRDPEKAKDAVQGFFADLLARKALVHADPERGRFRSFLLKALTHFLSHERDYAAALKRGGGVAHISIDESLAEECWHLEPQDGATPDQLFDRGWAHMVLDLACARLGRELLAEGQGRVFTLLQPHLFGETGTTPYAQIAQEMNMSIPAIKSTMHRLRKRYRALLRAEIAKTMSNPAFIEEELNALFTILTDVPRGG